MRAKKWEWSEEDDKNLLDLKTKFGSDWNAIVSNLNGRTKHAARLRYKEILSKQESESMSNSNEPDIDSIPPTSKLSNDSPNFIQQNVLYKDFAIISKRLESTNNLISRPLPINSQLQRSDELIKNSMGSRASENSSNLYEIGVNDRKIESMLSQPKKKRRKIVYNQENSQKK